VSFHPCSLKAQLLAISGTHRPAERGVELIFISQSPSIWRVLDYLRSERVFRRQRDIRLALNMSHPSAAWALQCLRRWNMVEVEKDLTRNPRYMRYRAKA
jgi:hypothetical protein